MTDDPDDTAGRQLYRARADTLAKAQMAMATRRVRLAGPSGAPGRLLMKVRDWELMPARYRCPEIIRLWKILPPGAAVATLGWDPPARS